ncbi:MAG: NAD(P)/FAD-dependent oxidoreductase [Acidobacteria bacterium]|nr:NAD(P)/FAD-dependent oxidoreductase [Acidobacteriota bacterium]MCW5950235.1 NAD(P)/FAD-dependent oxidoreductase [Pyrinomonadaceae bacterium]
MEHFDILIIGAGLSGIGAGARVRMDLPGKTFAILEGRATSGGTWDLFRYPGVRSDSDMFTLGYRFRPWRDGKAIADGPSILNYIRETAREYDLEKEIRYGHRVRRAEWNSEEAKWTVEVETDISPHRNGDAEKEAKNFTCSFLYLCTGYYRYEEGYTPEWPGFNAYKGTVIHPQKWPEDLDFAGKRVLVIGSGATAVTLVPAMAETAGHVTMLQRSPTYIITMPSEDGMANAFRKLLPDRSAYTLARWKNILRQAFFYTLSKKRPAIMKRLIAKGIATEIGEEHLPHFTPRYDPWDQRLCIVPDSDLFRSIRERKASIVTGEIETFTATGVRLTSGDEIDADIIVTATGLILKIMDGIELSVDGEPVVLSEKIAYKGMMYNDVPNLAQAFGYTNASWTLKCDLTSEYVCRLVNYMDTRGLSYCVARLRDDSVTREPALDFNSGYVLRALYEIPSQGSRHPWRLHQNYFKDLSMLRYGRLDDGTMEFH